MDSTATGSRWMGQGDINAFFGLLLDNLAGLVFTVGILAGGFGMPLEFVVGHMIPGTAIGVLVGDLFYTWLAIRLARSTGRTDVTAMPLGLDTPSIFGITIFVIGPAYLGALQAGNSPLDAANVAWGIGICSMLFAGIFKLFCATIGHSIRKIVPRAGLFGSLASIALVIISFVPLIDILQSPIAGMIALAIVLTSLVGHVRLPWKIPGTVAALMVGCIIHYAGNWILAKPILPENVLNIGFLPQGWLSVFHFAWMDQISATIPYLPVVIPFALGTVIGGLDCTESASAAGDEYSTTHILGVEALATIVGGFCGGVIQTTPYIGHPAYKAMGGRVAYTFATALVVGAVGVIGGFEYFYMFVPKAVVFPILVFIGLEITSQSFQATPQRHYPALVFACIPPLGFLAFLYAERLLDHSGIDLMAPVLAEAASGGTEAVKALPEELRESLLILLSLKNGFVLTSLLWASMLAMALDRRMYAAASFSFVASLATLFGFIHSPTKANSLFLPWAAPTSGNNSSDAAASTASSASSLWHLDTELLTARVYPMALAYLSVALLYILWGKYLKRSQSVEENQVTSGTLLQNDTPKSLSTLEQ